MSIGDQLEVSMKFTATRAADGPNFDLGIGIIDVTEAASWWTLLAGPAQFLPVVVNGTTVAEATLNFTVQNIATGENSLVVYLSGGGAGRHISYTFTEFKVRWTKAN